MTPLNDVISVRPLNSDTSPSTRTRSPIATLTAGELPSKTKMPSDVSGSASASASSSWTKKPFRSPLTPATPSWKSPTTMPSMITVDTVERADRARTLDVVDLR